ncbi:MAG: biopolymer transporter ExbD [Alphaproteobacteria bacterium]|nr:biopolymer transporter ExbD [Alphaproteobacteria bacterium]MCB9695533.1 biopolymer transporter ExbD [Alphaproteobacteria bacterium]
MSGADENEPAEGGMETYPPEHDGEHHDVSPEDMLWSGGAHHKKKRKKKKALPGETIGHLNLTPMMDIMTMLLVFLVMSFATEPSNINVSLDMRPPESTNKKVMEAATKVTITKQMILVEDKEVVPTAKVDSTSGQVSIPELRDSLIERADHLKALEIRGGEPFDGRLLVVADASTPYSLITAVLVTAGESKFAEYKLVVMQKGEGE